MQFIIYIYIYMYTCIYIYVYIYIYLSLSLCVVCGPKSCSNDERPFVSRLEGVRVGLRVDIRENGKSYSVLRSPDTVLKPKNRSFMI